MSEQISLEAALSGLSSSVSSQLHGIVALLENNMNIVDEAMNAEIEQYNTLIDQVSELTNKRDSLELQLNSQREMHAEELDKLKLSLAETTRELTAANLKLGTFGELKSELKRLKDLQPDRIKKQLGETKKRNQELVADNTKLRSDQKSYRKENAELTIINAELEKAAQQVHDQYKHMADLLNHNDGEIVQREFNGEGGLLCVISVFNYPMSFLPEDKYFNVINDFDFHIEIRTNIAINLTAACSVWGCALLPTSTELAGRMPTNLAAAVQEVYLGRMEKNHQFLLDRIDAMKEFAIDDVPGLTEKQIKLLTSANYLSVYAVSHLPDGKILKEVKGLGQKGLAQVREHVRAVVEAWERQNWDADKVGKYN
ncbi:hypothetical protein [Vibrio harveyi]|uniref:hypothetical protein n=1 Tax=Vibrio harveyi TaxID=669 RepID=UPI0025B1DF90|nr:hypothetical protein [Vibrio harveyi]WJT09237.1 hypothetical protein PH545_24740 [Vibrio harveyi]